MTNSIPSGAGIASKAARNFGMTVGEVVVGAAISSAASAALFGGENEDSPRNSEGHERELIGEIVVVDDDGNGVIDAIAADDEGDGILDAIAVDADEDGVADAVAVDIDDDGEFDVVAVEDDEGSEFDDEPTGDSLEDLNHGDIETFDG